MFFGSLCFTSFFVLIATPYIPSAQTEFHHPIATAMSSPVSAILKATVGLLVSKGRNGAAEKLKEGDLTNEQLSQLNCKGTRRTLNQS